MPGPTHATPAGSYGATRGTQLALPAIVTTARALGQLLDAYYPMFDRETSGAIYGGAKVMERIDY